MNFCPMTLFTKYLSCCFHRTHGFRSTCMRQFSGKENFSEKSLLQNILAKIRYKGPITIAEYMKEILTNSAAGYYMHKDVFGQYGDFTTSPEISQMFGELIGVWCVNEWMETGSPTDNLHVVEIGPGRGTLADDMLRVFFQFKGIRDIVSLHLVDISPHLSEMQWHKLCPNSLPKPVDSSSLCYRSGITSHGFPVHWYRNLADVPKARSFFLAHEFFDALPIHKFQKRDGRWHEILIDTNETNESLRFVLSLTDTAASKLLLKVDEKDCRDHIEICPEAGIIVEEVAKRIAEHDGFALLADYGHSGEKTDTFRAFRNHQLCDPLTDPGTADLTADVDFSYLKQFTSDKVLTIGPVTQEKFLHNMGIGLRLQMLLEKASDEQQKNLISGYDMLTNSQKMGERFKFMSLVSKVRGPLYVPAGFIEPA